MAKRTTRRILKVGFDAYLVPASITDQKIAGVITVLRELIPCDYKGDRQSENMTVSYECVRSLATEADVKQEPEAVPLSEFDLQKE